MTLSTERTTNTGVQPTKVRFLVLAVLCSLAFITYLDRICIQRAQGFIKKDLGLYALTADAETQLAADGKSENTEARQKVAEQLAKERMGWIFAAFLWGYVLFEIPGGWLGDTWGVRAVIVRIVIWWSVFTALTGSIDTMMHWFISSPAPWMMVGSMIAVRFLFGAGEAGAYPNISRVLSRWFPLKDRARVQGTIWLASRWGGSAAPLVFGWLLVATGNHWRMVFWILGVVGIAWSIAFWWWFREKPHQMRGVNEAEVDYIQSGRPVAGSIYDDAGHVKLEWSRIFGAPTLWAMFLAASCSSFCWYFCTSQLALFYQQQYGVAEKDTELLTSLPLLGGGLCCILGGFLSDYLVKKTGSRRWGRSLPGVFAFASASICILLLPIIGQSSWVIAAVLITLATSLQDLHMASLWSLTADIGGRYAGTLAGTLNMICNLGGALGMMIVPYVSRNSWWPVFWMNGSVYMLGAILWLFVNANHRLVRVDDAVTT